MGFVENNPRQRASVFLSQTKAVQRMRSAFSGGARNFPMHSSAPEPARQEQQKHSFGAFHCILDLYYENVPFFGAAQQQSRIVLKRFTLQIRNTEQKTTWSWECKKNGNALLYTPYHCAGTCESSDGEKNAVSEKFRWPRGTTPEDACREFIKEIALRR